MIFYIAVAVVSVGIVIVREVGNVRIKRRAKQVEHESRVKADSAIYRSKIALSKTPLGSGEIPVRG